MTPPLGTDAEITIGANSLFERITSEEMWACTTCKACDEICPVNIEILDKILDMRRYLSLMESDFPAELGNAYRAMENQSNPWGMNQGERGDWAKGLDDVQIVDPGEPLEAEYLYWVGCAGSFDDKNKKVTQAMAKLLHRAGIAVADPRSVGDVHRRLGPALGQRVPVPDAGDAEHRDAQRHGREEDHHPVPALLQHAAERVPAARRALRGDPPHAAARGADRRASGSTCRWRRSRSGSPTTTPATSVATTTCTSRRARWSARSRASRWSRCRATARRACAAAPAGRGCGWRSPSASRSTTSGPSEALSTGASRIATACPFCYIMLDDGVKAAGADEDEVKVADISIHLLDAIEAGERRLRLPRHPARPPASPRPVTTGRLGIRINRGS